MNEDLAFAIAIVGMAIPFFTHGLEGLPMFSNRWVRLSSTGIAVAMVMYALYLAKAQPFLWGVVIVVSIGVLLAVTQTYFHIIKVRKLPQHAIDQFNRTWFLIVSAGMIAFLFYDAKPPFAPVLTYRVLAACWFVLALIFFFNEWFRERKQDSSSASPRPLDAREIFIHLEIEANKQNSLTISFTEKGCPVLYPIPINNGRPAVAEIVSYSVVVFWDDKPVQKISWHSPEISASNAMSTPTAIKLAGDSTTLLFIPVNAGQVTLFPQESPKWGLQGEIVFGYSQEEDRKRIDLTKDNYKLTTEDWANLRARVRPSGEGTSLAFR